MPCAPEAAAAAVSREMAATAKHESALVNSRRKFPADQVSPTNSVAHNSASGSGGKSGDEDIAAIAKQISDHAEAIYQTWKSRGLAPTEILNCQAVPTDKFGSVLSPVTSPQSKKPVTSPQDILAQDNNNLEKLVNNFVVEDKARRQRSPSKNLPSSIAFALQKFEQNSSVQSPPQVKTPTQLLRPTSFTNRAVVKPQQQQHNEVFLETIDAKTTPNSGEWPLKAKLNSTVKSPVNSNANYLDEVAREEERLINALKTGAVIGEVERPKQKPAIARETKPKVEPVKPILISPQALTSAAMVNNVHLQTNSPSNDVKNRDVLDFAKVRFGGAIQQQEQQQTKTAEPIVSTTRSKFEPPAVVNSEPAKVEKVATDKVESKDEKDFIASRWGLRLNSSRPRPVEQVPHPELTSQQKQHIRQAATNTANHNPVRPFLTRGSVAERVLIFEKCPSELLLDKRGPRQPAGNTTWRNAPTTNQLQQQQQQQQETTPAKAQATYPAVKPQPKTLPPHTTLQRHVKTNRNVQIPRFYYPGGKPIPSSQVEATISRITAAFSSLPGHRASRAQFHAITKACDLPLYWKVPLFLASGGDTNGIIEMNEFLDFWKELCKMHHDSASKFVRIVTRGLRTNILPEDLIPLVQDVVETHPGLTFLKEATEFHSRYVHTRYRRRARKKLTARRLKLTQIAKLAYRRDHKYRRHYMNMVIARIFYCVNRSWSGKISVAELRRSNLLSVISILEHEEDINQVTAYFSYEHFYVIYCKFWELDSDHDLFIDKMDLTRHNDHAVSMRMIERIFSGAVTRGVKSANGVQHPEDKMSYTEFVWFLLSEEDKNHPTAIEYWFRCMDLDGDGYLSMYELEYFYEEQLHRMEMIGIETLPFEDCLCQMLDMVKPKIPGQISLCDLKKCKMTSIFFDTFFNLEKYLDHEQRDPFASARDHDAEGHELSDWDRFAAEEYELLVAEESGNDQDDTQIYGIDEDGHIFDKLIEKVKSALSTRPKDSQHDSCDSDDYADSDN